MDAPMTPPVAPQAPPPDQPADPSAAPSDEKKTPEDVTKDIEKELKSRSKGSKKVRKEFFTEWKKNVELRMGRPGTASSGSLGFEDDDEQRTEINPDWSLTKTKTANLFSQVPTVQGTHEHKQYAPAVYPFVKSLNYEISDKRANAAAAMEEAVNDMVNASGVAGIFVTYSALFETVQVPALDVKALPPGVADILTKAGKMPMRASERVSSDKFSMTRLSPTDLLWPAEFVGSDFNQGDFIGHTGVMNWSMAQHELKLTDEDKDDVLTSNEISSTADEDLRSQTDRGSLTDKRVVKYDELFYWRYRFDPDEKHFEAIWRIVFVHGKDKAVIHGPWKGQKLNSKGKIIGSIKFPIQIGTLTYISDNPIPPSDTSAGRAQVNDMRLSRSQMFQNRKNSTPLRWFDSNRVDTTIQDNLMRGRIQGIIPMNGDGGRAIGEVARASYPAEDFEFDQMNKQDLIESWQLQPSATPTGSQASGRSTKAEQQANQQNFATRIGQERGRVAQLFLNCCEVMAGLMALYSDFPILTDQEKQQMLSVWNDKEILSDLVLKIRPDSAIMLDVGSRLDRIFKFINMTVKSGYVNPKPLILEACELSGFDPTEIVVDPKPPKPDDPSLSYRFTGKEDLMNPVVLAFLLKQKAITPDDLEAAKAVLEAMQQPSKPKPPTPAPGALAHPQVAGPGHPGAAGHPPPAAPGPTEDQRPGWGLASKVAKRSRDVNG